MNTQDRGVIFPAVDSLAARVLLVLHEFKQVCARDVGAAFDKPRFAAALSDLRERGWGIADASFFSHANSRRELYTIIPFTVSAPDGTGGTENTMDVLDTPAGQAFLKAVRDRVR